LSGIEGSKLSLTPISCPAVRIRSTFTPFASPRDAVFIDMWEDFLEPV